MRANLLAAAALLAVASPAAMCGRGAAAAQEAGADDLWLAPLVTEQAAADRTNLALEQQVRTAASRGAAERADRSASAGIRRYLERLEADIMGQDEAAGGLPPAIEARLQLIEQMELEAQAGDIAPLVAPKAQLETYGAARAKGVGIKLHTAAAIEAWSRVVLNSTGVVIENDPIDVAHAKLEDFTRRREELQAQLQIKSNSAAMRSVLSELAAIDRQIGLVMFQITGVVWGRGKASVCFPPAQKGRPVAVFDCRYWAQNMPIVIDPNGQNIVVDRVRLEFDEDARRGLQWADVAYYARSAGEPPRDEPSQSFRGAVLHWGDGTIRIAFPYVDADGEERQKVFEAQAATDVAKAKLPGVSSTPALTFTFRRDPKSYISWEEAQAIARGEVPQQRPAGWTDDDELAPLVPAPGSPEDDDLAPLAPAPRSPQDDDLAPLVPAPGSPADDEIAPLVPAPGSPEDDDLAPLAPAPGSPQDDDLAPLVPAPGSPEDDEIAPLVPAPGAPGDDDLAPLTAPPHASPPPPASGDDDFLAPLVPPN